LLWNSCCFYAQTRQQRLYVTLLVLKLVILRFRRQFASPSPLKPRIISQSSECGVCGVHCGTDFGFSPSTWPLSCQYHFSNAPRSLRYLQPTGPDDILSPQSKESLITYGMPIRTSLSLGLPVAARISQFIFLLKGLTTYQVFILSNGYPNIPRKMLKFTLKLTVKGLLHVSV
jgi:hypothetical protein